jgi:hypothetical protein
VPKASTRPQRHAGVPGHVMFEERLVDLDDEVEVVEV